MKTNRLKFVIGIAMSIAVLFSSCKDEYIASSLAGLTEFGFEVHTNIPGLENIAFTIDQSTKTITNADELPYETDVTALVPVFEAIAKTTVMIGTEELVSGTKAYDFSSPVMVTVVAEDGVTKASYTVTVNVSQVNPEGVSWAKRVTAIHDMSYETVQAVYFNGKHRAIYGSTANGIVASKYMTSTDGISWTENAVEAATFPLGSHQTMFVFNNKMYIMGYVSLVVQYGYTSLSGKPEVWESTDGETFTKTTSTFVFAGSGVDYAVFPLENQLWVLGGQSIAFGNINGTRAADAELYGPASIKPFIQNTSDMVSWVMGDQTQMLQAAAQARYTANVVHDGAMYMIGGQRSGGYLSSDVWSSTDGYTWTLVSTGAFTARMGASAISYDGKIWLLGGQTGIGTCTAELLVSEDGGVTWMAPEEDALLPEAFTARAGQAVYLDDENTIWVVGGYAAEKVEVDNEGTITYTETKTGLKDVWSGKLNKLEE